MTNSKSTKRALLTSVLALLMCVAMLIGATFAWFTDTASTGVNKIQAGNLDVDIVDENNNSLDGKSLSFKDKDGKTDILWEPGATFNLDSFKIVNKGNLAFKYKVIINGVNGNAKLLEAIDFFVKIGAAEKVALADWDGILLPNSEVATDTMDAGTTHAITISGTMKKEAGNEYQGLSIDGIGITVVATQYTYEYDSNGNTYDKDATYPEYTVTTADALTKAAKEGGIITVNDDIAPSDTVVASGTVQLNMNGKKIANAQDIWETTPYSWALVSAQNGANLTITGNGTFAAKANDCYAVDVQDGSTVTITSGTFKGNIHAVYVLEGTAIIQGGLYSVQQKYPDSAKADEFVLNCYDANRANGTAKIIVTGGTFVNFNPADCQAEGAHTNFVAKGYGVVATPQANGDVWYTVVAESATGKTFSRGTHTLSTGITATSPNAVAVKAENGANITITGGAYDGGKDGNNVCVWAKAGSNVTIKDGTFTVGGDANKNGNAVIYSTGGNITIEGGFFYTDCSYRGLYYVLNQQNGTHGTITVKGGTFVNYDPSTGDDHNQPTNFVAKGYEVKTSRHGTDTWYTVVPSK